MGIQEDAGELLFFIYNKYISSNQWYGLRVEDLVKETSWDSWRLKRAIVYLDKKGLVSAMVFADDNFWITDLNPKGIDTIEHKDEFKNNFGFGINLGVAKFSWNIEKK